MADDQSIQMPNNTPPYCNCQSYERRPPSGLYDHWPVGIAGIIKPNKTSWPELVGATVEEASRKILEDMPSAQIQLVLPPNYAVTQDLRFNRVRLFLDESQRVLWIPYIA
ncbi:subtilisin inhibitor CLSI-I [Senna tora]|uniref:Subtilisin inhibitor CLSI-I n=1 Tax=Senna tora TaxID=362788 RepID=A0A834TNQ9_9FABA|nr:subtilisin inhibitor CLSI-I [Senna tora]